MGFYDKLSDVDVFEKDKYFQPGEYIVEILKVRERDGHKGVSIIIQARIEAECGQEGDKPQLSVGNKVAQVINMTKDRAQGQRNLMSFLTGITGHASSDLSDEQWKHLAVSIIEDNALQGEQFAVDAHEITTKAGNPFTVINWSPLPERD